MFRFEEIENVLSSAEIIEIEDSTVFYFQEDDFSWDEIYDLGLEMDAQIIGMEEKSGKYFVSVNY